jgi:hypothetical protein
MFNSSPSSILDDLGSSHGRLREIGLQLNQIAAQALAVNGCELADLPALDQLLTPLVKLYAAATEATGRELPPVTQEATATEVVVLACALLRAQNLNPFDLAIWFSRGSQRAGTRD